MNVCCQWGGVWGNGWQPARGATFWCWARIGVKWDCHLQDGNCTKCKFSLNFIGGHLVGNTQHRMKASRCVLTQDLGRLVESTMLTVCWIKLLTPLWVISLLLLLNLCRSQFEMHQNFGFAKHKWTIYSVLDVVPEIPRGFFFFRQGKLTSLTKAQSLLWFWFSFSSSLDYGYFLEWSVLSASSVIG